MSAAAGTGANTGAGIKPNGFGNKGPKVVSLGPETPRHHSVTTYTKGVAAPAELEPTGRVPLTAWPTAGVASLLTNQKGPKPQTWEAPLTLHSEVPELAGRVPQEKPARPAVPGLARVRPQSKLPKPVAPVLPISQGQVPFHTAGLIPTRPVQPAPFPYVPQAKAQKPNSQPLQPAEAQQAPVFLQGKGPKPYAPAPAAVLPQSELPRPTEPMPSTGAAPSKGLKPIVSEPVPPQTQYPLVPVGPAQTMAQLDGLKGANPELAGVMQPNRQGTKPAQTDCTLGGVSGQWTKIPSAGYGPAAWYLNSGGAKASKPGFGPLADPSYSKTLNKGQGFGGYGAKPKQLGFNGEGLLPGTGYGYGNVQAGVAEAIKGTSQTEPQTTELGPGAKSVGAFAGVGGLPFAGSPVGYSPDPYGRYGNPYGAHPFASKPGGNYGGPLGSKPAGNYGSPFGSKPAGSYGGPFGSQLQELSLPPQTAGKYGLGGLKYGGHGGDTTPSGTYGVGGLPYGASLGSDSGNTGKYGPPAVPYSPESVSLGGDTKSGVKYGNPALAFDALGPVTDGKSIDQPALPYEPLAPGPQIDGVKSVDQFGEREIPPQHNMGIVDGFGERNVKTDKYGTGAIGVQAEGSKESKYNLMGFFGNGYQG
ncbi:calymmin [Electrophorus electricus]|uniref:calymmin n=1 Tax=Electrophorus electricus TaxID=8005 RepID=UPI0015D0BCE1|nr:calymmin [Electrophorus electricus]